MGEERDAGGIADPPDALGRATALVDRDPMRADVDPDGFEAEILDARPAPSGDDEHFAADFAAVVELDDAFSAVEPHAYRTAAKG